MVDVHYAVDLADAVRNVDCGTGSADDFRILKKWWVPSEQDFTFEDPKREYDSWTIPRRTHY
jgi:hypothetical protein